MNQGGENTKINKNVAIAVLGFVLVLSVVIVGVMLWQKKQQTVQSQANFKVEDNNIGGNSIDLNNKNEEKGIINVSTLAFDSQKQIAKTDEKFSLKAIIDPKGKKISSAELHVVFDPKALELESVTPSDLFSEVLLKANIDNEKGTASIALGVPLNKPSTSEVSTIAIFNFKPLSSSGNTEVKFSDQTKIAAEGQSVNALASSSQATITMQK